MLEKTIVRGIVAMLKKKYQGLIWFYKASDQGTSGIPDIVGCYKGKFFAIEVKSENGIVSRLQAHTIGRILDVGGNATVVRSKEEVMKFLETM